MIKVAKITSFFCFEVTKIPTVRSEFSIEQFEAALQKFAHEQPKFTRISTDDYTITFSYGQNGEPRRMRVEIHRKTGKKTRWGDDEGTYMSFAIEPKTYLDSGHITKICDFLKEKEPKVKEFLEKIMGPTKPIPQFTLRNRVQKKD